MNVQIRSNSRIDFRLVCSRWDEEDGSGGTCDKCNRHFGNCDALEDHQEYCSVLLEKKKKAAEKTGVFEQVDDDEDEYWLDGLLAEECAWYYSETCLSYLIGKYPHKDYNLVKPGCYHSVIGSTGPMVHLNFKAKPIDGPVETFFAQLRICLGPLGRDSEVDCCESLGTSQCLLPFDSGHYGNCDFCPIEVRHPADYAPPPSPPLTHEP